MRDAAVEVVRELRRSGHEALFAGGSVRDLVMGIEPHDYDIATSARPQQVLELFPRTVEVGVSFGVVVVLHGGHEFQVATFRSDGAYQDGRHPTSVCFSSAEEDVARRDFTINGLLYDPETDEVIDHVDGRVDLDARLVRCIGDPRLRFEEDRLRLLRAVRFAVRFDFQIEPSTWAAVQTMASGITAISGERIRDELLKMLTGPAPHRALRLLREGGLLEHILPEVSELIGVEQPPEVHPEGDVFEHTVRVLQQLELPTPREEWERESLALAALLHDIGKPGTRRETDRLRFPGHAEHGARLAEEVCRRLRLSRAHIQRVQDLVAGHVRFFDVKKMRRSRLLRLLRLEYIEDLLALHRADRLAGSGELSTYEFCLAQLAELPEETLRPPRLLDGNHLISLGVPRGPVIGELLAALEDQQLEGVVTTREQAEAWVKQTLAEKLRKQEALNSFLEEEDDAEKS